MTDHNRGGGGRGADLDRSLSTRTRAQVMSHVDEETFLPGTIIIAAQDVVKEVRRYLGKEVASPPPLPFFSFSSSLPRPLSFSLAPWAKTLYYRTVV